METPFNLIKQVPEILAFAYTNNICEIKMKYCGPNLAKFIDSYQY